MVSVSNCAELYHSSSALPHSAVWILFQDCLVLEGNKILHKHSQQLIAQVLDLMIAQKHRYLIAKCKMELYYLAGRHLDDCMRRKNRQILITKQGKCAQDSL